ncbi:MAG: hypothetical protein E6R13_05620, partial [Spirochaetes bacterium]
MYPEKGYVEALDWKNSDECGNGLHGLEWGIGSYIINDHGSMWQIIKVDKNNGYRDLCGKVKFKCGEVILSTLDQKEAMDLLMKYVPIELKSKVNYQVVYSEASLVINCGFCSIITSGFYSTITSGFYSTITSGDWSTISTGYNSTIISGNNSTITS